MKTQLLRGRNAKMQECRSARAQKCRKMTVFCTFALLHFCFAFSILAQTDGGTFTDSRDGQTYKTVIMPDGKRWMAENLRYRKGLNNPIFSNNTTANTFLSSRSTYYCPGPGPLNASVYAPNYNQADPLACEYWGALYPFWVAYANSTNTAVNTSLGEQGICPDGWHLPTNSEWDGMISAIGATANTGYLLKDAARGTFNNNQAYKNLWTGSAVANKDSFGFSALAAGLRTTAGAYSGNGTQALFWTSTVNTNGTQAYSKIFTNSVNSVTGSSTQNRADALSVRCVEGECTESLPIVFTAVADACESIPVWNEIGFKVNSKTRKYNLSIPSTTGIWMYTITIPTYTSSIAPAVAITGNGTASPQVSFTISNPTDNDVFTISVVATNPTYCKDVAQVTFTLKDLNTTLETPVPNTITGGEAIGSVKMMTDTRETPVKTYEIIKMADNRWWMRENLNYQTGLTFRSAANQPFTSTNNGVPGIGSFWCPGSNLFTTAALTDCDTWGAFYTWEAAVSTDGVGTWSEPPSTQLNSQYASGNPTSACGRGICPPGWHVPSDGEWGDMLNAVETGVKNHNTDGIKFIGTNAGAILKSSDFATGTKQATGFSVLAAGYRDNGGRFYYRSTHAFFWSSSGYSPAHAWHRYFHSSVAGIDRSFYGRACGIPVRCLQD